LELASQPLDDLRNTLAAATDPNSAPASVDIKLFASIEVDESNFILVVTALRLVKAFHPAFRISLENVFHLDVFHDAPQTESVGLDLGCFEHLFISLIRLYYTWWLRKLHNIRIVT
jgi:hypothetical protein